MAMVDIFDYIEMFCNQSRRHSRLGGAYETRGSPTKWQEET